MTRPSRGISDIQEKARGTDVKKNMLKNKESVKVKTKKTAPMDKVSLGPAMSAGPIPGMGMSCGGMAKKTYYKGGKVDGCISKGHTKGKMV
jgi:hypothetical protein